MRHSALALAAACHGKARVFSSYANVRAGGRALRERTSTGIRIYKEMGLCACGAVSCPTDHAMMEGRRNVANEPVKASIALGRPMCYETREMANRTKEIKSCHSGTV